MNTLALVLLLAAPPGPPPGVPPCPSAEDSPDLQKLLTRHESETQGRSTQSVMTMTIKTPAWTRSLTMKVWTKGTDYALIRVLKGGPRETGMMTLKREKQLWNWLPQAARVMKLPSGMLGDSWLGSDFTNDDLVKGNSLVTDFDASLGPATEIDGRKAWHVVLVPKKDAVVVWNKVEFDIDRATCTPLSQRFFDEENKEVRKMTFSDVKQVGWRAFPATMIVFPQDPGRQTTVHYDSIEFDQDIPDDTFSVHRLQQGK